MFLMIEGQRNPEDAAVILILILASRIPVLQDYATVAESPTTGNMRMNAKPKMLSVMNVAE